MLYLVVEGGLGSTGIREIYLDERYEPDDLLLSLEMQNRIKSWLRNYEDEFFKGYRNTDAVTELDLEGLRIVEAIKEELGDVKVGYFSDAQSGLRFWP